MQSLPSVAYTERLLSWGLVRVRSWTRFCAVELQEKYFSEPEERFRVLLTEHCVVLL